MHGHRRGRGSLSAQALAGEPGRQHRRGDRRRHRGGLAGGRRDRYGSQRCVRTSGSPQWTRSAATSMPTGSSGTCATRSSPGGSAHPTSSCTRRSCVGQRSRADRVTRPVLRAAQALLTAAAGVTTQRVIVLSSAQVYGASPDHPVPLPEDFPLLPFSDDPVIDELLELEALAARSRTVSSGPRVTVLRPAVLVAPGLDTLLYRYFDAPRLLVPRDGRPCWQFCHVEDLASAVAAAVEHQVDGPVTVACDGWLETHGRRTRDRHPAPGTAGRSGVLDGRTAAPPWRHERARERARIHAAPVGGRCLEAALDRLVPGLGQRGRAPDAAQ